MCYKFTKFLSIFLSLGLVITGISPLCSENLYLTPPGYNELGQSKKMHLMRVNDMTEKKVKKKKSNIKAFPLTISAIILFGITNQAGIDRHPIEVKLDEPNPALKQGLNETKEFQEKTDELKVEETIASPEIPFGFFGPESNDLPARIRIAGQKIYQATARILIYVRKKEKVELVSTDSGVCISPDGYVMVAYHSIVECISDENYYIVVEVPAIENSVRIFKTYSKVKLVKEMCDEDLDIGVLKVESDTPFYYVKPESIVPKPEDMIVTAGHPRGTQRCYISAGQIQKLSEEDKPFQFRFNAYCRTGSSGQGIFLIDSDVDVHFIGIVSKGGGGLKISEEIENLEQYFRAIKLMQKLALYQSKKVPTNVIALDVINNSDPDFGNPRNVNIATNLSEYFSKSRAAKILSYADPNLTPFTGPTFLVTKSLSFTFGNDSKADRVIKDIIAAGARLVIQLNEFGIEQINITAYRSLAGSVLSLSYDTKNPVKDIEDMLDIENKRRKISQYCQQYGFMLDVDEEFANIDRIEYVLNQIKKHARNIGAALKGTKVQEIEISNANGIIGPTLGLDSEDVHIIQNIMRFVELEKLRIKINSNLTSYVFDINKILYGYNDIPTTTILLNTIQENAETISNLFKDKGIVHIIISKKNRLYKNVIYIDYRTIDPIDAIKDVFTEANREKTEANSINISKAGRTKEFIKKSN